MRLTLLLSLIPSLATAAPAHTMRVDYFHTGDAKGEHLSLSRVVLEPLPFPGSPTHPIDDTNLGKYLFEVRDRATNRLLYSRGFSSIYGEWEETPEARLQARTFEESVRFPAPKAPVQVLVKKRDPQNAFRELGSFLVDPGDMMVDSSAPPSAGPLVELVTSGPPEDKVDLLILGDGYTAAERPKFLSDAQRLVEILFRTSPFKEHRQDFNVWALCPPSRDSGISRPLDGIHRRSPLGATYDAFGSERYILTFDNRAFRDFASQAPYDFVEILTNSKTYGGGGIFNLYSTVAADSLWSPYVFVHEFGHHFAGLADEYFTSESFSLPDADRAEPWEPNVTATREPERLKWKALVGSATPIPTPWKKAELEGRQRSLQSRRKELRAHHAPEREMDALFTKEKGEMTELLSTDRYARKVGAFEGAMYESRGYFRPQEDCVMFSRDDVPFCAVCQAAIRRVMELYLP